MLLFNSIFRRSPTNVNIIFHIQRRCLPPFRWMISSLCCRNRNAANGELGHHAHHAGNGGSGGSGGVLLLNSTDSVRTLTTSLTITKRSSMAGGNAGGPSSMRPSRDRVLIIAAVAAAAATAATAIDHTAAVTNTTTSTSTNHTNTSTTKSDV